MEIEGALALLKNDASKLKVFRSSVESSTESDSDKENYKKKFLLNQEPELRLFWRGIMLQAPSKISFRGAMIYRWIKQTIRNSQTAKIKFTDTETFFETHKEEHPYIILGLGDPSSSTANFLGEFSKMPNSPFEIYLIQD